MTRHRTSQWDGLSELNITGGCVLVGHQEVMKSKGSRKKDIMTMVDGVKTYTTLNNALYVSELLYNVMSVSEARKPKLEFVFDDDQSIRGTGVV